MLLKRTQIYLEPKQHCQLKKAAAERGISMAELLRRILNQYLHNQQPEEAYLRIVSLGKSGRTDVSEQHDRYLAEALYQGRS